MQFTESIYIYQQNRILQKTLTWLELSLLLETKDSSELQAFCPLSTNHAAIKNEHS